MFKLRVNWITSKKFFSSPIVLIAQIEVVIAKTACKELGLRELKERARFETALM